MNEPQILSEIKTVSMSGFWYENVSLNHFWIERRFEVFRQLFGDVLDSSKAVGEIGSGNGLLQKQVNGSYGIQVDGYDLNYEEAKKACEMGQHCFIYDIHERHEALREKYDVIFLFDVIEHIDDDLAFLDAVVFHLKKGGRVIINVPAVNALFSKYDASVGHKRRYCLPELQSLGERLSLKVCRQTYWGLGLVPILLLRKLWLMLVDKQEEQVIQSGIKPSSAFMDLILRALSKADLLPQRMLGSSCMVMFEKK